METPRHPNPPQKKVMERGLVCWAGGAGGRHAFTCLSKLLHLRHKAPHCLWLEQTVPLNRARPALPKATRWGFLFFLWVSFMSYLKPILTAQAPTPSVQCIQHSNSSTHTVAHVATRHSPCTQ